MWEALFIEIGLNALEMNEDCLYSVPLGIQASIIQAYC